MLILLHSSKTMRAQASKNSAAPLLLPGKTAELGKYLKTLSLEQIQKTMKLSAPLAEKTQQLLQDWSLTPPTNSLALDAFAGDIYSGLQAHTFSQKDRDYANEHLRILSGLYGLLLPYNALCPYRLEMGYRFPDPKFKNLYTFWGDSLAKTLPQKPVLNLASEEYSKAILPFLDASKVISPQFLTCHPKTGKPTYVVVHAKIAKGAFARWMIQKQIQKPEQLPNFTELNYAFDPSLSTPQQPAFVCKEFGGKGLSIKKLVV
jgi:cytoplasmic iron level regulating protein YaaA (DUF328/UPF0246 family)